MKQNMIDKREPRAKSSSLLAVTLYLEAAGSQSGQSDGITADLGIVNPGSQALSLLNPYEMLQFLLVNQAGFPVQLPKKAPGLLTGKRDGKFDSVFPVTAYFKNSREADRTEANSEIIGLAAHETVVARFVIDRLVEAGKERPLPDGTYRVSCIATLINADNREESRVLESPPVEVHFTRK